MNLALAYDTETTGLPLFHEPSDDPRQPHLVQLAAMLVDLDTRETVQSMDVIIKPNGWIIPDDVAQIHGITTEHADDVGVPEEVALAMLLGLWRDRLRIAHNESFDQRIIRIALKRYLTERHTDDWRAAPVECTCKLATPICALPPTEKMIRAGRRHHKTANLGEAYLHFTGKELQNAHTALADVQACLDVYFAIKDQAVELPQDYSLAG